VRRTRAFSLGQSAPEKRFADWMAVRPVMREPFSTVIPCYQGK
jgi:hypothetical protein